MMPPGFGTQPPRRQVHVFERVQEPTSFAVCINKLVPFQCAGSSALMPLAPCRRRGGIGRRAPPPGGPPGPPWLGGGPLPPGMGPPGMGRGGPPPGPPPPGSKAEARLRQEARREERRAALFKRQVAAMEVSPTMLGRPATELRENILRGGPDVAPASSYEELPASQVGISGRHQQSAFVPQQIEAPLDLSCFSPHETPSATSIFCACSTATGPTRCCWTRRSCRHPPSLHPASTMQGKWPRQCGCMSSHPMTTASW